MARTEKTEVLRVSGLLTLDNVSKDPCPWQSSFIRGIFALEIVHIYQVLDSNLRSSLSH
jgi:hypothetical protein